MLRRSPCTLLLAAVFGAHGCGGDDSGDDSGEPSAIAKEWPAPGRSCGDLGNDCSGCSGSGEICYQSDPEICIPRSETVVGTRCLPGSCASKTPYCIAEQCLTLEQATCMCAGALGSKLEECEQGPEYAAGLPHTTAI